MTTCTPATCYMSGKVGPEAGWKPDGLKYVLTSGLPLCKDHRESLEKAVGRKQVERQHASDREPGMEG